MIPKRARRDDQRSVYMRPFLHVYARYPQAFGWDDVRLKNLGTEPPYPIYTTTYAACADV